MPDFSTIRPFVGYHYFGHNRLSCIRISEPMGCLHAQTL